MIYFVSEVCQLCSFSPLRKKKKTQHLQDDHDTHKQKGRLLFAEHIWTSLRLNIPNVTWAGNDLFTGSVVTPAKRRGGGGRLGWWGRWGGGRWVLWKDMLSIQNSSALKIPLCSSMMLGRVWRCNLPFDFHSAGRMGGCRSLLPGATTSNPYQGQAGSLINTD